MPEAIIAVFGWTLILFGFILLVANVVESMKHPHRWRCPYKCGFQIKSNRERITSALRQQHLQQKHYDSWRD